MELFGQSTINIGTVFRREFKNYFNTSIGYIFAIFYLMLTGFFFFYWPMHFWERGIVDMTDYFVLAIIMFSIFIPAISMRLWAEEIRTGTIETLLTFPLTDTEIILGKFFAAISFLAVILAASFTIPFSLPFIGSPSYTLIFSGYLVVFIMGAAYISLGLFLSSLVKNQINAFVMTLLAAFLLTFSGWQPISEALGDTLGSIAVYISLYGHFENMKAGILDLRDITYFLSFIGIFIYLNHIVLINLRSGTSTNSKTSKAIIGLTITAIFLGNIFISSFPVRYDLTGKYSFTETTEKLVEKLQEPVVIEAFVSKNVPPKHIKRYAGIRNYIKELAGLSSKIKLHLYDPRGDKDLEKLAASYGIRPSRFKFDLMQMGKSKDEDIGYDGMIVRYGDKRELIPNIASTDYAIAIEESFIKIVNKFIHPNGMGVSYVTNGDTFKMTEGRQITEKQNSAGMFIKNLETDYVKIDKLNLKDKEIDSSTRILLLVAPKNLSEAELFKIDQFVLNGGNVIYFGRSMDFSLAGKMALLGSPVLSSKNINNFFAHYGARVNADYIMDLKQVTSSRLTFNGNIPYPYLNVTSHKGGSLINNGVFESTPFFIIPWASSITLNKSNKDILLTKVASSSPAATLQVSQAGGGGMGMMGGGTPPGVMLNPQVVAQSNFGQQMPGMSKKGKKGKYTFAVLLQPKKKGKWSSYFKKGKLPEGVSKDGFIAKSKKAGEGSIFVLSTPYVISDVLNLLDMQAPRPMQDKRGQEITRPGAFLSNNFAVIKAAMEKMLKRTYFKELREKQARQKISSIRKVEKWEITTFSIGNLLLMPLIISLIGLIRYFKLRSSQRSYTANLNLIKDTEK